MATTNWVVLDKSEVTKWLSQAVVNGVLAYGEENSGENRLEGTAGVLQATVDRVRAAVRTGGRTALSITPNAVPPEARAHAWALVVAAVVEAQPQVDQYALKEGFTKRIEKAEEWLEKVASGDRAVTPPSDPDPATALASSWGDYKGENIGGQGGAVDLTTDDSATPLVNPQVIDGGTP